jgi:hypothetical protein
MISRTRSAAASVKLMTWGLGRGAAIVCSYGAGFEESSAMPLK